MATKNLNSGLSKLKTSAFVRQSDLLPSIVPISPATLWRWIKKGDFPAPVRLGDNLVAWRSDHVLKWISERVTQTQTNAG